jgi:cytoplasmic iron level regulating protein YaaA (DUF328/UPF0246 family)
MIIVLSPAKSLDYSTPLTNHIPSSPLFSDDAAILVDILKNFDTGKLCELMAISHSLAEINADRFNNWSLYPTEDKTRQALFTFNGDVYLGLNARTLNVKQVAYLQKHLCILSGLYGVLRPLDLMQPYRLEMGSRLENVRGKNLYEFWGGKVTEVINNLSQRQNGKTLINLASEEYFKVIRSKYLTIPVVTPVFQDYKNGNYKIISFFAKRARGLMARYCAINNITSPEKLKKFDLDGYSYVDDASDQNRWVFRRKLELA